MPLTTDERMLTLSRDIIESFDKADGGIHPGFRPAHAKGILLSGVFTPSQEAASLTRAPHIQRKSTPVTVRFSYFAGIPTVADNDLRVPAPADARFASTLPNMFIPTSLPIRLTISPRARRKNSWVSSTR